IALTYRTPVFLLSDGYLANGSEPWQVPVVDELPDLAVDFAREPNGDDGEFLPYLRDPETLARPWAIPGTPGLMHRVGGLEKEEGTGNVSYDPENHDFMVRLRAEKIQRMQQDIPELEVFGAPAGKVLVLGWGSTYGSITTAVEQLLEKGHSVSSAHLRYLNPFPKNLGDVLRGFETVIIPELNLGQLALLVRAKFLVDAVSFTKVKGKPFKVTELVGKIKEYL
ncbi:MAG: 2-oxoglutarate ferredoxin oxidoreductase subunit alpha, partial [Blastocatellia bacterium]|nr:2-oxoglutarate ferredoxin oxidoreductase subunit alpha [Blastocatellia bacterium]